MWFLLRKKWFWFSLLMIFIINTVWPVRGLLSKEVLFNTYLVVLTNEAELRPCGGFATMYGRVRVLPPKIEFKNVYALKGAEFGEAPDPINNVAEKMRFWDLGTSPNLAECTEQFHKASQDIDLDTDDVILVDIATAEKIIQNDNLFADLTRSVANTDRHDEQTLKERKSPLASVGRKAVFNILVKPWSWPSISREIAQSIKNGNIYIPNISSEIQPETSDFALYEWNLGGGKSSRFLHKELSISAREISPRQWRVSGGINFKHLGQYDQPLSQDWQGIIELKFPMIFNQDDLRISANLKPGESWNETFSFDYSGNINNINVFNQRGQRIFLDINVSLFGQQTFNDINISHNENVGYLYAETTKFREKIEWITQNETTKPFLTLHTWTGNRESVPEEYIGTWSDYFANKDKVFNIAEVHFSEPVVFGKNINVIMTDKDFENKEITEDPVFQDIILLADKRTALIGFWQNQIQPDERFYISFSGVLDSFDNEMSLQKYTIIDRINE